MEEGYHESFREFEINKLPQGIQELDKNLPCYLETPGYILTHAGLNFEKENPMTDETAMLWIRNWYHKINKKWLGDRIIIHGHTPTIRPLIQKQLEKTEEQRVLDIDCGCVYERKD